jgi:hypothetical protein
MFYGREDVERVDDSAFRVEVELLKADRWDIKIHSQLRRGERKEEKITKN